MTCKITEKNKEKKKTGIIRRILKWVGLAVLTVLIILGLIFEAPWKIITLLLIVLAACRILPKPAIKWFWLSVAAIVVILTIWVFLPDDNEGWRPYTFDEELAALEAKYAIPDSENAAKIYDELPDTISSDPNKPEFFMRSTPSSTDKPWLLKDHPETAEWLKGYQSTIEKLLQAAKKDKCQFPIPADMLSYSQNVERLPKMRRCTFLLLSAANNDIAEGWTDAGLEKYLCIIRMAEQLYQQPIMIDFLSGFAIERSALNQLNRFLVENQPTPEQFELIGNTIKGLKNNWSSDLPRILESEKLMTKNLCSNLYEINTEGKVRLSRDPLAGTREQLEEKLEGGEIQDPELKETLLKHLYPTYWQRKILKAKIISRWFSMPSTPLKLSKIVDTSYKRFYAMTEPDFDWTKEPKGYSIDSLFSFWVLHNYRRLIEHTADMAESGYYGFHETYLRNFAFRRGSQLLSSLRRYKNKTGHWPESLDEIKTLTDPNVFIDPINGDSFVYKLTEENFTLYSKGENKIDEEGKQSVTYNQDGFGWPKAEKDDMLIWPTRSSKTQGKKIDVE